MAPCNIEHFKLKESEKPEEGHSDLPPPPIRVPSLQKQVIKPSCARGHSYSQRNGAPLSQKTRQFQEESEQAVLHFF